MRKSLQDSEDSASPPYYLDCVTLIRESHVVGIAGAEHVGCEVEDLLFGQHIEQRGRHGRDLRWFETLNLLAVDVDSLIRIGEVRV